MTTNCRSFGQPLLNTRNDLRTGLVNGDTGIVVNAKTGRKVVFSTQQQSFEPSALEDIEVAFATTIHKCHKALNTTQSLWWFPPLLAHHSCTVNCSTPQ